MKEEQENNFGQEDEKFYFKNEIKNNAPWIYLMITILIMSLIYVLHINWLNLNEYNSIKSNEKYPVEQVYREQVSYFGKNYENFKSKSEVNTILDNNEANKFWSNCIGSCEIPESNRFQYMSNNQSFINWVCNERIKEEQFTGMQYAMWKINKQGCILTNSEEIKKKDQEDIRTLKWEKQKEIEVYIVLLLLIFLLLLHFLKKIKRK